MSAKFKLTSAISIIFLYFESKFLARFWTFSLSGKSFSALSKIDSTLKYPGQMRSFLWSFQGLTGVRWGRFGGGFKRYEYWTSRASIMGCLNQLFWNCLWTLVIRISDLTDFRPTDRQSQNFNFFKSTVRKIEFSGLIRVGYKTSKTSNLSKVSIKCVHQFPRF